MDRRDLRDLLERRLGLSCDDFEAVATAGIGTAERLGEMLDNAAFAFLVLTSKEQPGEGRLAARANVVHEIGLFQGTLGFRRAIVLLEEGCEAFSNIAGLGHIRFPQGNINAKSEEIRRVLAGRARVALGIVAWFLEHAWELTGIVVSGVGVWFSVKAWRAASDASTAAKEARR